MPGRPSRPGCRAIAEECSAALPTMAMITIPTNVSGRCTTRSVPSSDPTRISPASPVAAPARRSRPTAHQAFGSGPSCPSTCAAAASPGVAGRNGRGVVAATTRACVRSWNRSESPYMTMSTAAISSLRRSACGRAPAVVERMVGTARATTARKSVDTVAPAATRSNRTAGKRVPATTIAPPAMRSRFPRMLPVRLPFTSATWPSFRASRATISSAAFPKVALRRLPSPGPRRSARSSVASPIAFASGTRDRQETAKRRTCCSGETKRRTSAIGRSSQDARHSQRDMKRRTFPGPLRPRQPLIARRSSLVAQPGEKRMRPSRSCRWTLPCSSSTSRLPITSDSTR